jgi:hypothetical protein
MLLQSPHHCMHNYMPWHEAILVLGGVLSHLQKGGLIYPLQIYESFLMC